jgi:hypothetical protein
MAGEPHDNLLVFRRQGRAFSPASLTTPQPAPVALSDHAGSLPEHLLTLSATFRNLRGSLLVRPAAEHAARVRLAACLQLQATAASPTNIPVTANTVWQLSREPRSTSNDHVARL